MQSNVILETNKHLHSDSDLQTVLESLPNLTTTYVLTVGGSRSNGREGGQAPGKRANTIQEDSGILIWN